MALIEAGVCHGVDDKRNKRNRKPTETRRSTHSESYGFLIFIVTRRIEMLTSEVLVLNAGFIPIRITSVKEAICLLTSEKAVPVVEEDRYVRSPSLSIRIPSVISVVGYSSFPRKRVAFSKLNVIYRDDMACQYCGRRYSMKELTATTSSPQPWSR